MSGWLIGIVTLIYVGVAVSFVLEGKPGMALTFLGYSVANVGIIWASR
jgi:hypothetical protein